jgi:hypothetical protein
MPSLTPTNNKVVNTIAELYLIYNLYLGLYTIDDIVEDLELEPF